MRKTLPALLPALLTLLLLDVAGAAVSWSGAVCCREALVPRCVATCKRAASAADLRRSGHCRPSHEAELFRCLSDRKRAKGSNGDGLGEDEDLSKAKQCCAAAETAPCRAVCAESEAASAVGRPGPSQRLQGSACSKDAAFRSCVGVEPPAPARPLYRLELLCCSLADTAPCRRLCRDAYSLGWHLQGPSFELECLSSEYGEPRLRRCVRDAEVPCQPNSGRLRFCRDFTASSTGLYRHWDQESDDKAKMQYIEWMRSGKFGVPFRNLSIVTTGQCRAELRRLACFLQLQPCRAEDHSVGDVCRSDCMRLSERCLTPSSGGVVDIAAFCSLMAQPDPDCVRMPPPEALSSVHYQTSSPCLPSPCGPGEVCRVGHQNQSRRVCRPGCRLSSVTDRMAPVGSAVLLPSVGESNKLSLLMCTPGGELVKCRSITIPRSLSCISLGRQISSGTVEQHGCQSCVCVDGELVCRTAAECAKAVRPLARRSGPRVPTCLRLQNHRCSKPLLRYDPCEVHPCQSGYRCEPHPELCVDSLQPCAEHTCVPETSDAIADAVSACEQSVAPLNSVEESTWRQPYVACPVAADRCEVPGAHCTTSPDCQSLNANCSHAAPPCGRSLRLYFSGRRLAALGARLPARAALAALRHLVGTMECVLTGRLEAPRQLIVTVTPERAAAARACHLEADKLRAWLASGSPVAAAEPSLWPVMHAELAPEPGRGRAPAGAPRSLLLLCLTVGAVRIL
ncbi:reversion-inducing cysteine-rich protein with Kazal motifs-like [Pollicipes pollicipes]|uniref:reversion-inducing cysteine-rich protein with Kazal motifs-like n=1 Tax=Pollicipes pollicipes TaxID=41117 RepID=UPI001885516F|nr:reversion-inducing cysteine-rich protein with Kazal motifs-like [Pollicipes pollicipes]